MKFDFSKINPKWFLAAAVILVGFLFFYKKEPATQVDNSPPPKATISFSPQELNLKEPSNLAVMIDVGSATVAYGKVEVAFDTKFVELSKDVTVTPQLGTVIEMTPIDEANNSGRMVATLGLKPGDTPITGSFEFMNLPLKAKEGATGTSSVTVILPQVQIVNMQAKVFDVSANEATLSFE